MDQSSDYGRRATSEQLISRTNSGEEQVYRLALPKAWLYACSRALMSQWLMAARQLLRRRGFAFATVALLAGGLAADTTVFSLVSAIFLTPLPYPDADRLVYIFEANTSKQEPTSLMAPVRIEDWNRLNQTFTAIAGYYSDSLTDRTGANPERLHALSTSPRFFAVYGAKPEIGRTFTKEEGTNGGPNAVVISYGLWTRRFNRSPHALGSRLRLGNDAYTVVGVMPSTFVSPVVDIWLCAKLNPYLMRSRDARFYTGIGRLRPGVTVRRAQEDLARVQRQLGRDFPLTDKGWSALVSDMKGMIIGDHGRYVWIAFAAVAVLMLLACINLAGLLLGQIQKRQNELAIRTSLGATRWQLMMTILREIVLLAAAGVALGSLISVWAISAVSKIFATLPRISELQPDWRSLVFTGLLGVITILVVGLLPAIQATRSGVAVGLSQGGRAASGRRHSFQQALLLAQFSITVVLLFSAGLLLRSYARLAELNAGFNPDHVLTFHVGAEWGEDRIAIGHLQQELIATLQSTPGISAAGVTNFLPTDEATLRYQYEVDGLGTDSHERGFTAGSRTVSGGYLSALGIPMIAGSNCPTTPIDLKRPPKALVNQSFAGRFGPGQNVIGRRLRVLGTEVTANYELIGVVADIREDSLRTPAVPYVYTCSMAGGWPDPEYVVRTKADPKAFIGTLRQIVHKLAPDRALFGVETMQDHVNSALEQPRLTAQLLAGFALAAVLLAAFGLYSLCTLVVSTRTREIGTRMALGARSPQVITGVLSQSGKVLAAGLMLGIVLALAAGRLMRSLLFGITPFDPLTLLAVCALLAAVCFVAMLFPAIRAASIDPIRAIREQ